MKVLIGCNGGLTGIYLARNLSELKDIELYGFDSSEITSGKFFVKKQSYLPSANSHNFIEELIKLINEEKIDFYFPTHSKEMREVAKKQEQLKKMTKCRFMISPFLTYESLENKSKLNDNLLKNGIPTPKKITNYDCTYPIIMKNDVGSGGSGKFLVVNEILHRAFVESFENVSFYEYIEGLEFTVDCLFDNNGKLVVYNQRIREKTIGGAVSISRTCNDFNILPWINKMSENWRFCGCVNFQYILKNNIPYFIDINLRFPSGGLPVTVAQGYDIPKIMIKLLKNEEIENISPNLKSVRMYRYFEERFEDI